MFKGDDGIAIVSIQAFLGAKPDETCAVLENSLHGALREALLHGDAREMGRWRCAESPQR